MRIMVLGAAHIGRALVEALHEEHEMTVVDIDSRRLASLSDRYDIRTVEGDGTT
jgi:trk system potassium uptake protein TrkA